MTARDYATIAKEIKDTRAQLTAANKALAIQNTEKYELASELISANKALAAQNEKHTTEFTKTNRLYAFISQINQYIARIKDERLLFNNACQIAYEFGRFKIAWIGLFNYNQNDVTMVDQNGITAEDCNLFKNIPLKANGPQGIVLRTGNYFLCNDILNEAALVDWKPLSIKYGINACLILPIYKSGLVIGTFNLYAATPNFYDENDIRLLKEAAGDISFALDRFENEKTQKLKEQLIAENEKRFRALIEHSNDMIAITNTQGKLLYGSPHISIVLGYTFAELQKMFIFEIIHPDDIAEFEEKRKLLVLTPGQSFTFKHRRQHKNGKWIWCEGICTNMINEAGINAIVSNFRDVTEKKEALEALLLTEFAIDNAGDAVFWLTPDARFYKVNRAACAMLGYSQDEMLQLTIPDIDPFYNAEKWKEHFEELRAKGSLFFETIQQAKNGRLVPVEIRANYIKFGNTEFNCAFSRDITERKNAEKKLLKSENALKEAQAISHIGNWEINLLHGSEIWSDELYNILKIEKAGAIPSRALFLSVIHPDSLNAVLGQIAEGFKASTRTSFDFKFICNESGAVRYGYSEVQLEFDEKAKPLRQFGIIQDVTDRKLAEMERTKMVNDLMLRNTDLEQFGYIISHNLRAPVANIIGSTNVLDDPDLSVEDREILHKGINASVIKLDEVVTDLNNILQIRSNTNDSKESVCFADLTEDIKFSIRDLIDKHGIGLRYDFSEVTELLTLKPYLYSVFYNLISNSIKYRRPSVPCVIEIKSQINDNKIALVFTDNGTGIDLNKNGSDIFGLYKRFHSNIDGKGMGLFMVKTQVETLGGKISVKSAENKGTEFTIRFDSETISA